MTKQEFFGKLAALYACANRADSSDGKQGDEASWVHHHMAGKAFCQHIDRAIREMVAVGVLTEDEAANWLEGVGA